MIGDAPDKSSEEFKKNHGEILRDAERYHLRKMTLADFKQQMDYQKSSSVEHFGSGSDVVRRRRPGRHGGQGRGRRQAGGKARASTADLMP